MTSDEAAALGQKFGDADVEGVSVVARGSRGDVEIPVAVDADGEATGTDQAGALVHELTEPRCDTGDPNSILP
ncbi:MAG: hypothetical protein R2731_14440 [Nocardioides sp.]